MPVHPTSSNEVFEDTGMPGLQLDPAWAISFQDRSSMKAHKQLPRKRDYIDSLEYVTSLPLKQKPQTKEEAQAIAMEVGLPPPSRPFASPAPPLTPPSAAAEPRHYHEYGVHPEQADLEQKLSRSGQVTPTAQNKPPTPDITPPRLGPVLHHRPQPSLSSRAESFRTAREEISSDDGSEVDHPSSNLPTPWASALWSPLSNDRLAGSDAGDSLPKSNLRHELSSESIIHLNGLTGSPPFDKFGSYKLSSAASSTIGERPRGSTVNQGYPVDGTLPSPPTSDHSQASPVEASVNTMETSFLNTERESKEHIAPNLDRETQSSKTDFRQAIARVPSDDAENRVNTWRHSGLSTTSTVEAIVVDTVLPKHQKLRHTQKNASLRSASSPMPQSNRTSWNSSASNEQRRLVRRPAKLTNENRWSLNSDVSKAMSNASSVPSSAIRRQVEVIPVIVVPQRKSSLKSSNGSSRRHSTSNSQSSGQRPSADLPDSPPTSFPYPKRARAMSDSIHERPQPTSRGRNRQHPPVIPPRTSSLSAPTSRNGSRASSLTSDKLRMRRLVAEDDIHQTLAKMENSISKIPSRSQETSVEQMNVPRVKALPKSVVVVTDEEPVVEAQRTSRPVTPASDASADTGRLRPPSMPFTSFSQQSIRTTSSPGTVEVNEATAINYYAHNNHSLQLIENRMFPESIVVRPLGKRNQLATPEQETVPQIAIDSPLRNPRDPPQPPAFNIIPPTPGLTPNQEHDRQLGPEYGNGLTRKLGSVKRAFSTRRQSEPFRPVFVRTLSTTKARNKKLDENLDHSLHPFWRPRGFWDDQSDADNYDDDMVVNNSLGMLQPRTIFQGPLSVVRRLSDRQRRRDKVRKRSSRHDLRRNRIYTRSMAGLTTRLQFQGWRNIQDRLVALREQRDEQKRERRRTELRKSIGPNIQPQGDSRFPISPPATRHGDAAGAGLPIMRIPS